MKKLLSIILALTLVLAFAVPAFAAEHTESATESKDVEAEYTAPVDIEADPVYRMNISWAPTEEDPALTYTAKNSTYTWNTTELIYKETVNNEELIGWAGAAGYTITVTNYSNATVTAATEATNTYELDLDEPANDEVTIGSAAVDANGVKIEYTDIVSEGTAQNAEFEYIYSANDTADAPTGTVDATIPVGNITVSISID